MSDEALKRYYPRIEGVEFQVAAMWCDAKDGKYYFCEEADHLISSLRQELKEARENERRLNWIATHLMHRSPIWLDFSPLRAVDNDNNDEAELRAAIDAALAAEQRGS